MPNGLPSCRAALVAEAAGAYSVGLGTTWMSCLDRPVRSGHACLPGVPLRTCPYGHAARGAGQPRWRRTLAWNWGLSIRRKAFQRRRETVGAVELHRLLIRLKGTPGYGWLYEVSKCAPQEALRDLDRAYANSWRGRKAGRRVGRPRLKKKGRCPDRFRLTGAIRVEPGTVTLPRIGRVRTKEATSKFRGRLLSATCRREADRIRNQRVDARHKATTSLAKAKSVIVVEDLHVAGLLRNRHQPGRSLIRDGRSSNDSFPTSVTGMAPGS
jgi:transposase